MRNMVITILSLLLLTACTTTNDKGSIADGTPETEMPTEAEDAKDIASTQGIESLEPVLTLDKALELFYNTFENNTINFQSIKFKKDNNGNYRYFIEGWDDIYHYELEIDVGTAEIIEQEKKIADGTGDKLDLDAAITPKAAMDIALEGMESEAVEDWELKVNQNNRMIYEINFLSRLNRKVDALSGGL